MRYELNLARDVGSPARARSFLGELKAHVPSALLADLRLLVSELVTNAVRHAGMADDDRIGLRINLEKGTSVRVEVTDPGRAGEPTIAAPEPERSGGWGLYLVETLADRWGVERNGGTRIWFEISLS